MYSFFQAGYDERDGPKISSQPTTDGRTDVRILYAKNHDVKGFRNLILDDCPALSRL